jgi:hypothetical protein
MAQLVLGSALTPERAALTQNRDATRMDRQMMREASPSQNIRRTGDQQNTGNRMVTPDRAKTHPTSDASKVSTCGKEMRIPIDRRSRMMASC